MRYESASTSFRLSKYPLKHLRSLSKAVARAGVVMRIRIPSKRMCQKFHLAYELNGAQKGVDVLTEYYGIGRMKISVDGRRVRNGYEAQYFEDHAWFTKRGLNKRNVIHELYHHIVEVKELDMSMRKEEKEANLFVREVIKKRFL